MIMEMVKRRVIEAIKEAKNVTIIINEEDYKNRIRIHPISDRRLAHEVAIALQEYWIKDEKRIRQRLNEEAILRP